MTREKLDVDSFDSTITQTTNETLTVDTSRAEDVVVQVDSGTTDGAPNTYDLTVRAYHNEVDDMMQYDTVTGSTSQQHTFDTVGSKMEFEFNNQSASDVNYRIVVKSHRDMD
jgi:hypothetical protein